MLSITLTGRAPAMIAALQERLTPDAIGAAVESAAEGGWKSHLEEQYVPRTNRLGGATTSYWQGVYASIRGEHRGMNVTLTATGKGLRMKYEGGTIRPTGRVSAITGKPIRFLAIPIAPEAHGKTPADFEGLGQFAQASGYGLTGPRFLHSSGGSLNRRQKGKSMMVRLFAFVRQATIRADKNITPSPGIISAAVATALQDTIANAE